MKKLFGFVLLFLSLILFASCEEEEKKQFIVTFYSLENQVYEIQSVLEGSKAIKPIDPTNEGFEFSGWYLNGEIYDFSLSVTENIDLYAEWEKEIELLTGYYETMNGHLDDSFKETIHLLLKSTHKKTYSYSDVWTALKTLDKDPANSDNIICLYTGKSIPIANQDKGSAGTNLWNREHSWPNSHGFSSRDYAAYTDLHHLFASEKNINATRGNKDFNVVTNGNSDEFGNKWNNTFFEPRDEVKGDLARAMFYLVVRYDDPSELDLELSESATSSSSNKTGQLGVLSVLLAWHEADPVSDEERLRNEGVYSMQGNRNPFVDHPEWVSLLYPAA